MGLQYRTQRGWRVKRYFINATIVGPTQFWYYPDGVWRSLESEIRSSKSSHSGRIRTIRAFRRYLRKWSKYLPPGTQVRLESRHAAKYDVVATIGGRIGPVESIPEYVWSTPEITPEETEELIAGLYGPHTHPL